MKNLIAFLLAFSLFILNGCMNQQPKNVVEQNVSKTPSNSDDIYHPVSVIQKDTFSFYKKYLSKKPPLSMMGYSVPYVTIEPTEKAILSTKSNDSTTNTILPKMLFKTSSESVFNKKSQFFTFKAGVETVLKGAEGTTLTIPADCFEAKEDKILRGDVQLELKEYLKTSDMILANLVTQSNEKLLETGGMIYLNATDSEGNTLKIRSDKDIKITLPRASKTEDKQLFYGNTQPNGRINWTVAKPIVDSFTMPVYTIVEQNPEFPEGQAALFRYIQKRLVYPKIARENRIEGTVYVGFTVMQFGQIANVHIKRGIGYGCNEVAMNIVKKMPRWKPARTQGVNVPVAYTLPIRFRLDDIEVATLDADSDSLSYIRDTAVVNKYVEILDAQEYVMRTQNLGWLNCDRFLNLQNTQRTDFVVWNNKTDAEIRLVFKNYRSIMASWSNSEKKVHFAAVPVGQPVFIVATSPEGGKFNVSVTETIIAKDQSTTIELKTVEKEAFLRELHRVDTPSLPDPKGEQDNNE